MTAKDIPWSSSSTLMQWAEQELRAGRVEEVRKIVHALPPARREVYKELLVRIKQERKAAKP